MFWSNNVSFTIVGYNNNMIDCYILCDNATNHWRATGIYGYPSQDSKILTCDLISNLNQTNTNENWLLFGDFNLIFNSNEKQGGRDTNLTTMNSAHATLNDCNLIDLCYHGDIFTWSNNQAGNHHIKERLDRFCATPNWITKFPRFTNYHLMNYGSDHSPILLVFGTNSDFRDDTKTKHQMKRFENFWTQDPECLQLIKATWKEEEGELHHKLNSVMNKIHHWSKAKHGSIPKEIKATQTSIQALRNDTPNSATISQIHKLENTLDGLFQKEEQWWAQRAKVQWLHHGDKNSSYFHFKATQRQRKNRINFITDTQGNKHTQNNKIQEVFNNYFTDLFTSSNPSDMQDSLQVVANRVHPQMESYLSQDFTQAEVAYATHQLKSNAAPGPDGLNANFYQHYWDTIGGDVSHTVLNILNNGGSPETLNNTYICLIPKNKHPATPADFRPIALCNVILKIITKTIANRIKTILPEVISPQQSAFLPGRLITDNTLLAFETFHYLKHNRNKKKGYVGIKLDMAKAYDRLEWSFIENTLSTMGFPMKLVHTIMRCVSTVSFSTLVNGQPSYSFKPHRGIRQGDPLSPYLFILCADVFSGMITKSQNQSLIHGIAIAHDAPKVCHLFFADDSILLCKASKEEAGHLKTIFDDYQRISGQKINMEKSEMTFSPCIYNNIKAEVQSVLPFTITDNINKYLGMPTQIGQSKQIGFNFIMNKVKSRLKGWKERLLSFAGRGILISAVIQALPTYIMSCFLIPKGMCEKIEQASCKFWWGSTDNQKRIHWKAKKDIFKPKLAGGLGFRDMHLFNKALLAKQVWRLQTDPTSLLGLSLKAKYYPNSDILHAQQGRNSSYAWQSIYQAINTIRKGSCWKVGNGQNINIWEDNWVAWQNGYKVLTPKNNLSTIQTVNDLILNNPDKAWNTNLIDQHFFHSEGNLIKQTPLIKEPVEDQLMWPHTIDGHYSVKTGYHLLKTWQDSGSPSSANSNNQKNHWKTLWSLNTIPRHKVLLWRIIQNTIPVKVALSKRGIACNTLCPRCLQKEETLDHVFMHCVHASKIWFGSKLSIKFDQTHDSFSEWIIYAINSLKEEDINYIAAITYGIWFARNQHHFNQQNIEDKIIIRKAHASIQDYILATTSNQQLQPNPRSNSRNNHHRTNSTNHNKNWRKPDAGFIKINSDANLGLSGRWGLGVTCCDTDGVLIAAATWEIPGPEDSTLAEAYALYNATHLALECCFRDVQFESDNARVITLINSHNESPRSYVGNLIRGIRCNKGRFRNCSFHHINREAN
jgi:hypothetical protein